MTDQLPAREALYRLLAAAWDAQSLPAPESIPWPDVLSMAEPSNLAALLYTVTLPIRASMPAAVLHALEQAFYRTAAENTRYLHQLVLLGAALSRVGAPLLLLKGAALAEALYADPALRLMGDIDLAVPPQHVPACRKVLLELGYLPGQIEHRPGSLLTHSNQELFEPPKPYRAGMELHWHVLDIPYYLRHVPMDWFWANSETRLIAGQPFQVLSPEANLLYLPAHLALHHKFQTLHPFVDLALLILHDPDRLDWAKIVAAARSFELMTALRETLDRLAQRWPSLPIDEPRRQLHAVEPTRTDQRLYRLLTTGSRSATLDFYTTLVSLPDFAARARFAWFNLFPQPAYMMARYAVAARWQLPYWYLYRLAGGLPRLARMVPRAWRLDRERR